MDNTTNRNSRKIKDILGNEYYCECIGCSIAKNEIKLPGGIIYEDENIIIGADPEIPIPGFCVITSKRHIRSFSELTRQERIAIGDVIACVESALKDNGISDTITLVQEERSSHFHIWIFPEHEWMTDKYGRGIQLLRDISRDAKEHADNSVIEDVLKTVAIIKDYFANNMENFRSK